VEPQMQHDPNLQTTIKHWLIIMQWEGLICQVDTSTFNKAFDVVYENVFFFVMHACLIS
jgi:hypothetical protein